MFADGPMKNMVQIYKIIGYGLLKFFENMIN